MTDYFISDDKGLLDAAKIQFLLKDCFWSKGIPIEYVERFIKHSLCFGAYIKDTKELIGFGRVISDLTTYAYICDVVIDPQHRRKGIATRLLTTMRNHSDLQGLKAWSLRSTPMSESIYEKLGFEKARDLKTILEIENLNIYIEPNFINHHAKINLKK